jgi:hypothetical protein
MPRPASPSTLQRVLRALDAADAQARSAALDAGRRAGAGSGGSSSAAAPSFAQGMANAFLNRWADILPCEWAAVGCSAAAVRRMMVCAAVRCEMVCAALRDTRRQGMPPAAPALKVRPCLALPCRSGTVLSSDAHRSSRSCTALCTAYSVHPG